MSGGKVSYVLTKATQIYTHVKETWGEPFQFDK